MDFDALSDTYKAGKDASDDNDDDDEEDANDDGDDDTNEDRAEASEENEEDNEDEDDRRSGRTRSTRIKNKYSITFKDVENLIRSFSEDEKYPVARWIMDFEETAEVFGQRMVFAKKSLRGLAKLFIQGERGLNTWKKLKKALKDEFSDKINSAELHRQMDKRKIKKDDSVQTYFLTMREQPEEK